MHMVRKKIIHHYVVKDRSMSQKALQINKNCRGVQTKDFLKHRIFENVHLLFKMSFFEKPLVVYIVNVVAPRPEVAISNEILEVVGHPLVQISRKWWILLHLLHFLRCGLCGKGKKKQNKKV